MKKGRLSKKNQKNKCLLFLGPFSSLVCQKIFQELVFTKVYKGRSYNMEPHNKKKIEFTYLIWLELGSH